MFWSYWIPQDSTSVPTAVGTLAKQVSFQRFGIELAMAWFWNFSRLACLKEKHPRMGLPVLQIPDGMNQVNSAPLMVGSLSSIALDIVVSVCEVTYLLTQQHFESADSTG